MAFTLILPIIQITGFILAIGKDPIDMKIAVKNYEVKNVTEIGCPNTSGCNEHYLSCRYLKCLENKRLILIYFKTEDEALNYVKKGYSYAALVFQEHFSTGFKNLVHQNKFNRASFTDIENSIIVLYEDRSNMQISALLLKKFFDAFSIFSTTYLKQCSIPTRVTQNPICFEKPIYGASLPNYTDFTAPGAILTMSFFLAMALSAYGMIIDRKEGTYERVAVEGVRDVEILISHIVAEMLIILLQCTLLIIISFKLFNLTNEGNLLTVFFLTIVNAFSGLCFGFFASTICKDEQSAAVLGIGSTVPIMILSGMIWPIEAMHRYLQIAALFLPLTKSVESLRAICHRGWGVNRPLVYQGFLFTFGWILFFLFLCFLSIKLKKRE